MRKALIMVPAAALTAVMAAGTSAAGAQQASLPRISANSNCWHGTVRPHHVFIGQGSAPEAVGVSWGFYGQHRGQGPATFFYPGLNSPARHGVISVHRVRSHSRQKFFTRMEWSIPRPNGTVRVINWNFRTFPGATCPAWMKV